MSFTLAIILLVLAIGGVVVRKTYYYLPTHELKRQAEKGDPLAAQLYRAVAYGGSLRGLLWLFIALTSAGGFIMLARTASPWLSFVIVICLLWAAYHWLPASRMTKIGARLTRLVTPLVVWLLHRLHPILEKGVNVAEKRYSAPAHTGIFELEDLVKLIEQQQWQTDNRLTSEELEIARRALSFDEHKVADILTPRKKVKTVLANDTVGPILIDELHKSGQEHVLVRDKKGGMVIGTLEFKQLGIDSQGKVKDLMNSTVYYVHENDTLGEALHAFFITNHPLFIVVNSFEEYIGIISVENILKQLLGHVPGDDFDQYADVVAVAARHPKVKKSKKTAKEEENTGETPEEVVE